MAVAMMIGLATMGLAQQPTAPAAAPPIRAADTTTPKLVLFITIDAMRSDYLQRFESQL